MLERLAWIIHDLTGMPLWAFWFLVVFLAVYLILLWRES